MARIARSPGGRGTRWALVVSMVMVASSLSIAEAAAETSTGDELSRTARAEATLDGGVVETEGAGPGSPVGEKELGPAPDRPARPDRDTDTDTGAGEATRAAPSIKGDVSIAAIDTSDRAAVLASYNAEFNRVEPLPDWTGAGQPSCVPGSTSTAHRESVIQRINWYRAMAGMEPVVHDAAMSDEAQATALMMAAEQALAHYPGPGWACWNPVGSEAAARSNLALGASGVLAIDWYMEDFGANNAAVGHRWWLMQPSSVRMGTGDIPLTTSVHPANAVYVYDEATFEPGTGTMRDPDRFWSWPPPGHVPEATVWPRWSLHADRDWGTTTSFESASVVVSVDGQNVPVEVEYRDADSITFVPSTSGTGDRDVTVTVAGIQIDGRAVTKSWTTSIIGASEYVPITPCRVLDTRGWQTLFGPGSELHVQVAGSGPVFADQGGRGDGCGIPMSATAVTASITSVAPWRSGYLRAWPSDEDPPNATFLNYTTDKGTTNTGAIPLGYGQLALGNHSGVTDVVVDVQGYFTASSPGTRYTPVVPCRVADTRAGGGAFASNVQRTLRVTGTGPQFASQGGKAEGCGITPGASALAATVTAVTPSGRDGYLRAWPAGGGAPNATFLNYVRGEGISNTGAVSLSSGSTSQLSLRNYSGTSHYVVDAQGYYSTAAGGARYVPITPCRVIDTRGRGGAFAPNVQRSYRVTGSGPQFAAQGGRSGGCGVPPGAVAVEASMSAVGPTGSAAGYLRAWPAGQAVPNATFLNYTRGQSTTNTGAVPLSTASSSQLSLRNYSGTSHFVVDVMGYFVSDGPPSS